MRATGRFATSAKHPRRSTPKVGRALQLLKNDGDSSCIYKKSVEK